jgi:hypothetical protein
MGFFFVMGHMIAKVPALFIIVMPALSVLFIAIGFKDYTVEDSVAKLWIPESTSYAADSKYKQSIVGGSTSSSFLGISKPRNGGNVMTADLLLELRDHLNRTQGTTVTVDGTTFTLQDVCTNPAKEYVFPCLHMTVLDCFAEGGYDFSKDATQAWAFETKKLMKNKFRPQAIQQGLDIAVDKIYPAAVMTGLAQQACNTNCTFDGLPAALAEPLGQQKGSWETNPSCSACLNITYTKMPAPMKDGAYVLVLTQIAQTVMPGISASILQKKYNASTPKEAFDLFLRDLPQVQTAVAKKVDDELNNRIDGKTPYTFKTFAPLGTSRQELKNPKTGDLANETAVLAAASSTCYAWDGGAAIPANLNVLLYGRASPTDFNASKPLVSVQALQQLYSFLVPEGLQARLARRPVEHGGPLSLTLDQAKKVLAAYKQAFEDNFSANWQDSSNGKLQHTAFADDAGARGSFGRTLTEMTTNSLPLIAIYGGLTVLLSACFFVSIDCVASRAGLVALGSAFALLGCFAALGLSAMLGINLNVVHFWIMPFIIVGIGIDDMFMLTLSTKTVQDGSSPQDRFAQAFANVAIPITMTSLVNLAMFAIMAFGTDIRAIYQAGYTGLIATVMLYLTMLLSFSGLIYLDAQRRAARRYECLPCFSAREGSSKSKCSSNFGSGAYDRTYRYVINFWPLRILVLLIAVLALAIAAWGMKDVPVGLDLNDFFPVGSQVGQFTVNRKEYFPVWPVKLNWGELAYTSPDVQLRMAQQFEQVLSTTYIADTGLKTSLVWTAKLATWGINNSDPNCRATFKNNTLGLKLVAEGGFCNGTVEHSSCPVLEGLSEQQLARCIAMWKNSSTGKREFQVMAPGIPLKADGLTPVLPIRYSAASGSVLFAYNLWNTGEYTDLIKQTRKFVDDDQSLHAWMSGIPYDYWEQYLTIFKVMLTIGGLSVSAGFVISFAFLMGELSFVKRGTCSQRICASFVASFFIALVSTASLLAVVGYCALTKIRLSGFTAMSCVMSTGLAVEYSVHVVHRFLEAPPGKASERVHHAMGWLLAPSGMAFLTSAFSVLMMAFSEFRFVRLYFFAPLAYAVITSYFFGVFALPCLLSIMDCLPPLENSLDSHCESDATKDTHTVEPTTPLSKGVENVI